MTGFFDDFFNSIGKCVSEMSGANVVLKDLETRLADPALVLSETERKSAEDFRNVVIYLYGFAKTAPEIHQQGEVALSGAMLTCVATRHPLVNEMKKAFDAYRTMYEKNRSPA